MNIELLKRLLSEGFMTVNSFSENYAVEIKFDDLKKAQAMHNALCNLRIEEELADHDTAKDDGIFEKLNQPVKTQVINGVTLEYDILGGVNIKNDDFVFARVFYDHRYAHNAARKKLAKQIAMLISGDNKESGNINHDPVAETTLSGVDWNIDPVLDLPVGTSLYAHQQKPLSGEEMQKVLDEWLAIPIHPMPIDLIRLTEKAHNIT